MACATTSATPNVVEPAASLAPAEGEALRAEEAAQIEAAKRHPIALTYERPRDPAALPVPPPKIPSEPQATAPAPPTRAPDQVIIVGQDRPQPAPDAPVASHELSSDASSYPVAPGTVTYESDPGPIDSGYVWVDGAWVASTPAPSARWGVYLGSPGWERRYPRAWAPYPPVVVVPGAPHYHYGHRHYVAPPRHWHSAPQPRYRPEPRGLRGSERRRDVYVAPSARPSRAPSRVAPIQAPAARSRGEARGGSRGEARGSGRGGSSGSGRRSVHVGR